MIFTKDEDTMEYYFNFFTGENEYPLPLEEGSVIPTLSP